MQWNWDKEHRRYTNGRGQIISPARIRKELDSVIASRERQIELLTKRFVADKISFETWITGMRDLIKPPHTQALLLAWGGRQNTSQQEIGWLGSKLKFQYERLAQFGRDVENGTVAKDARMIARAKMYANASISTYENAQRRREKKAGQSEERSLLHEAEHCESCQEEADKGWVEIGTLIPVGERTCLVNCKCSMEYR